VLLLDPAGQPVRFGRLDTYGARQDTTACQLAASVVGSWDGIILADGTGELPIGGVGCAAIPFGRYHVWAWRGLEYELWQGDVDLTPKRGRVALDIPLERA